VASLAGCGGSTQSASTTANASAEAGSLEASTGEQTQETATNQGPPSLVVLPAEFTEESMPMRMLSDGDSLHLWKAPQGGHVVLVAAKVENLTSNTATLKVRMRRPGGIIIAEESRTVAMVPVPGEPNRMQPDIRSRSQVAHVPLCPDYDVDDIVDQVLEVDIEVAALYTDPPVSGKTTLHLTPSCVDPQDQPLCRCECQGRYVLGRCAEDAIAPSTVPEGGG
jgi:hypothetical protein